MWRLLLLVGLASVATVPVQHKKPIPHSVLLSTPERVDTEKPGDGTNKHKQGSAVAPGSVSPGGSGLDGSGDSGGWPPPPCKCPEPKGWTQEELEAHRLGTNLTGSCKHCFCSFNNEHWVELLRPLVFRELCSCPSVYGWSLKELQMHNAISNIKGTADDCFCSLFDQHTAQNLIPHGPVEANCTCPDHCGWTEKQLIEIERITGIRAMSHECFCMDECGYTIRHKTILNGNYEEVSESGNVSSVSTISPTEPNNKLMLLSMNGTLKEFRLGSIFVKF
ncbi:hypothetical protein C0J52_03277 [Blattella germanica]|nr:hypothetical protein C0J52_03277 [Blattella germanica]